MLLLNDFIFGYSKEHSPLDQISTFLSKYLIFIAYKINGIIDINYSLIILFRHIHKQKLHDVMTTPETFEPYYPHLKRFLEWPRTLFLEPFSTKTEPFTQWYRQPYSFVNDDFCHNKPFTAKVNASTGRSVLKIKQTVSQSKTGGVQLDDEVKLWFDLPSHGSLYTKVKSTDYIKIQYDHGLRQYKGKYFYVLGGIHSNRLLNNLNFRLGLGLVSQNCNSENRLRVSLKEKSHQFHWYHKTYFAHKRARFGFMTVVDLNRTVFQKNNFLFGYHVKDNTSVYLRAEVDDFRQNNPDLKRVDTIFDSVTADVIHTINNKSKAALEVKFNLREKAVSEAKAVYQFQYAAKKTIKASVSNKLSFALLAKTPVYGIEDIATLTAGVGVNDLNSKNSTIKTGFELNVNL